MYIAVIAPTQLPARRANTFQVMKMTQALASSGHQVRLAVPGVPGVRDGSRGEKVDWEELALLYGLESEFHIEWLPASPRLRRYDYAYRALRWARSWGAELIYTRLPQAAALASAAGLGTIFEVHDIPQGRMGPFVFHRFLKGSGARRLVAISRALARDLSQKLGAPISPPFTIIAPDGVDLARYADLPGPAEARSLLNRESWAKIKLAPERYTAGYTGHFYPGRGVEMILRLAKQLPQINFLLVGGEPQDVARLQAQAKTQSLDNLILSGFVPNAKLPRYQAACDVLLMPYQRQVAASSGGDIAPYLSPMKLFEYLASERPILSSNLSVLLEVLHPGNAVLLPPDDEQAWYTALEGLHADPVHSRQLAGQARLTAQQYTWEARAVKIMEGLENSRSNPDPHWKLFHV